MSRASTPTLLSLDRWARILSINPVHFSGGIGSLIWPLNGACADVWPQYSWQTSHELVGREEVAMVIATVEDDIGNAIGYSPAATWQVDEHHTWSLNRTNGYRTYSPLVQTEYGMLIAGGARAVSLIDDNVAVVYSDPDADGWSERATLTVTTSLTDVREIKVYFAGHSGDVEWEIRPLRSVTIAGGVATITLDAWLLFNPNLWETYPHTNTPFTGIDVTVSGNFVTMVDVYREYNDTASAGVTFHTGGDGYFCCGGAGCDVCNGTSYGGCLTIRDHRLGMVAPFPASYSDGAWVADSLVGCRPANRVSLRYYAGLRDKRFLTSKSLDPLSQQMAEAITWMSAARLPEAICSCNNVKDTIKELQKDASTIREGAQSSPIFAKFEKQDIFSNPFGTKVGEVKAWQRVTRLMGEIGQGGAL